MQHRYVRPVAVAAVAAIAATTFSACSTPSSTQKTQKTLTITDIYEKEWGQSLEAAAADYTKAHPDVTVKVQTLPYAGYQPALQTQFVGGAAPDIALIEPPAITDFSARGFLAPLTSALDEQDEQRASVANDLRRHQRLLDEGTGRKGLHGSVVQNPPQSALPP